MMMSKNGSPAPELLYRCISREQIVLLIHRRALPCSEANRFLWNKRSAAPYSVSFRSNVFVMDRTYYSLHVFLLPVSAVSGHNLKTNLHFDLMYSLPATILQYYKCWYQQRTPPARTEMSRDTQDSSREVCLPRKCLTCGKRAVLHHQCRWSIDKNWCFLSVKFFP